MLFRSDLLHQGGISAADRAELTGAVGLDTRMLEVTGLLRRLHVAGTIRSTSMRELWFLAQAGAAPLHFRDLAAMFDAIDGPLGYIYSVVAASRMEGVDVAKATNDLEKWHIADTWRMKKFPCGYIAQGAIDAALRLREQTGIKLHDITACEIRVPHLQPYFRVKAQGEFSGKFGYEYPVASAILDGYVIKSTFSDAAFKRAEMREHLPRFKTLEDPASSQHGPLGVLVIEARGKTILQPIEIPIGDCKRPVPPSYVVDKYITNASEVVGE